MAANPAALPESPRTMGWNVLAAAYPRPDFFPRTPSWLLQPGARNLWADRGAHPASAGRASW